MAYLQLRGIEKFFGEHRAIKGIDLTIQQGEFIVFVGPSGCGKSTLLRLIAGLEGIDGGSLMLDGRDITDQPSSKRDLAMVFQSYALYPHMSVYENMSFALKLAKVDKQVIDEKVQNAARILNLSAAKAGTLATLIASYSSPEGLFWAKLSAASLMAIAPIVVFGWFSQKQLVQGLTFGAVK